MAQLQDYDFRSEEVKEILGTPPNWIIRYGTLSTIVGLFFIGSIFYFIKFPDKISGTLELNTLGNVVDVTLSNNTYLDGYFISNDDKVIKDQALVVLKNNYNYIDFLTFRNFVDTLSNLNKETAHNFFSRLSSDCGPFKNQYNGLINNLENFQESVKSDNSLEKTGNLRSDYRRTKRRIDQLRIDRTKNIQIYKRRSDSLKRLRNQLLDGGTDLGNLIHQAYNDSIDASIKLESIDLDIKFEAAELSSINAKIRSETNNKNEGNINYWDSFQERILELQRDCRQWENDYIVRAPIGGRIYLYNNVLSKNQYYDKDEPFIGIIPTNSQETKLEGFHLAKVNISSNGYGKVKVGQDVIVKFDSYPFRQFGVVRASVYEKQNISINQNYAIKVKIPEVLTTSFGDTLRVEPQMLGKAEILTEERRFLERIFEQFLSIFKNH